MVSRRRLARDPLADLVPEVGDPGLATPVGQTPTPSRGARRRARITIQVDDALAQQVRDAVMWLHKVDVHTTISAIAEAGLRAELGRLSRAHNDGHPFPPRSGQVPTGRPPRLQD